MCLCAKSVMCVGIGNQSCVRVCLCMYGSDGCGTVKVVLRGMLVPHINHPSCRGKEGNFRIIGSAETERLLCIKETLLIHKNKY